MVAGLKTIDTETNELIFFFSMKARAARCENFQDIYYFSNLNVVNNLVVLNNLSTYCSFYLQFDTFFKNIRVLGYNNSIQIRGIDNIN